LHGRTPLGNGRLPLPNLYSLCVRTVAKEIGEMPALLAQEIRDLQPAPTRAKVNVIRVDFDQRDGIPADAQEEISKELRSRVFGGGCGQRM
jgi:hypothetical protein